MKAISGRAVFLLRKEILRWLNEVAPRSSTTVLNNVGTSVLAFTIAAKAIFAITGALLRGAVIVLSHGN
ncbi:MAG TPA: hypothetical protein VGO56_15115 [Pyrinomonadaceae bacterium]|nr:hypothetical protein [Pyrinomonadaceae bacterium]